MCVQWSSACKQVQLPDVHHFSTAAWWYYAFSADLQWTLALGERLNLSCSSVWAVHYWFNSFRNSSCCLIAWHGIVEHTFFFFGGYIELLCRWRVFPDVLVWFPGRYSLLIQIKLILVTSPFQGREVNLIHLMYPGCYSSLVSSAFYSYAPGSIYNHLNLPLLSCLRIFFTCNSKTIWIDFFF